jgi:hypothetical protein
MLTRSRLLRPMTMAAKSRSALTPSLTRSFSHNDSKYPHTSLVEMQRDSCAKFADRDLFGTRCKKNPAVFNYMTYGEFGKEVSE